MVNLPEQNECTSYLFSSLEKNGLHEFSSDTTLAQKLYELTCQMLTVNEHMNLTTITSPEDIIVRHYVDSLSVAAHIPDGSNVLDLGCGAGFPCLPLALARPDLHITAVDSTEKKVRYVEQTATLLGIPSDRFCALSLRAEQGGAPGGQLREKFNIVVSRAVARLCVLGELALPCLKVGGTLIAPKGARAEEELAEAQGLTALGAGEFRLLATPLAYPDREDVERHALVMIGKQEKTPKIYPRKYAQILKKPL